jgi:hypothetical protein
MYPIFTLAVIVQIICAVHVLKTGRPFWWLLIILFGNVLGCIIYGLVEVLPEMRRDPSMKKFGSEIVMAVDPSRNIRRLEEELSISDTVKNRQLLAEAYVAAGRYEDAVRMYQSCLKGIYADDPPFVLGLAFAQFLNQAYPEAKETIDGLAQVDAKFRPLERRLLLARTLEAMNETDAALEEYEPLAKQYPGEEAKCRYALLLKKTGQTDLAREVFERILLNAKRSPRYYRKIQRHWINVAKQNVGR